MSSRTTRWYCRECKREWVDPRQSNETGGLYINNYPVSITGNPPGKNCPTCGSPEIELIQFAPPYPGLDIPREEIQALKRIPVEVIDTVPSLVNSQSASMQVHKIPEMISKSEPTIEDRNAAVRATMEETRSPIYDLTDMD